ncbi:MAG: zinc ribbon domain-containing protein [Nitrospina sp.]|jgi:predicted amidophosphoribosyltransferase|nr:zinc ribbon domain-containing protein [Nitrospina sp.]MBT5632094.1 zinc ribbon domain-containing protein [Nitrospina sp.]
MALIPCQECGKKISDKASACVNCGAPVSMHIKNNPEINETFPEKFSAYGPQVPCRICQTDILKTAYICPNCGIRNPDTHKNKVANVGLFLFVFSFYFAVNYDTLFRWGTFLPLLRILLMLLIAMGWLWYAYQKALE